MKCQSPPNNLFLTLANSLTNKKGQKKKKTPILSRTRSISIKKLAAQLLEGKAIRTRLVCTHNKSFLKNPIILVLCKKKKKYSAEYSISIEHTYLNFQNYHFRFFQIRNATCAHKKLN